MEQSFQMLVLINNNNIMRNSFGPQKRESGQSPCLGAITDHWTVPTDRGNYRPLITMSRTGQLVVSSLYFPLPPGSATKQVANHDIVLTNYLIIIFTTHFQL